MRKKVETLIVVGLNDQNVSTYLPEDSSSGFSETVAASSEEDELDLITSVIESDMAGTKIKKLARKNTWQDSIQFLKMPKVTSNAIAIQKINNSLPLNEINFLPSILPLNSFL